MRNHLPGRGSRRANPKPMHDVVEPSFEDGQQHFTGVFRRARRQLEIAAELAFVETVEAFEFLLFAQTVPYSLGLPRR